MRLSGLWIQDFRSFTSEQWQFRPGLNVIAAPNGSGKSNLIESIVLLSTGHSWRANMTDEFVRWNTEYARIQALVELESGEKVKLEHLYTRGSLLGKRTNKRLYRVNDVGRRQQEAVGQLLTVTFAPEDMVVFQSGPSERRRLLDTLLDQVFPDYRYSRRQYEQALRRRNKLIQQLRIGAADRYDFFYWDQLLIEHGEVLHTRRQEFLTWLTAQAGIREPYQIVYDHSTVTKERIRQYAQAEVGAGYTLIGPHKDDVKIQVLRGGEWRDIEMYGSRGEQRLSLVWWKLHEVKFIEEHSGDVPVLLLDDVFSELDAENQEYLLSQTQHTQTLLTSIELPEHLKPYSVLLYSKA